MDIENKIKTLAEHLDCEANEIVRSYCDSNFELGSNEPLLRSIIDFDAFVDEAISIDGRGHFMSSYDGHENELNELFIYRVN